MKRTLLLIISILLLSGCSMFNEVNESVNYVDEATQYIQTLSEFGKNVPTLIQETNLEQVNTYIADVKSEITNFITIDPPQIANDVHQQLVVYGEDILNTLNNAVENGEIVVDRIANSDLFQTIHNVSNLMNTIENLGL
ncbi:DUF6376 family protein [Salirhabdus sp. Marseille-P4669]|uniref:DUF6376 family protein n=1 Tax=Salirhabdus sp. Marseille-P4669 TaxID=2042310 RepID=UPI000C7A8185|nr:DUF6376 family protein [Salirhabdus sp. Marseille-P4669]